jgi:hypothetical protein
MAENAPYKIVDLVWPLMFSRVDSDFPLLESEFFHSLCQIRPRGFDDRR